MIVTLSPLPDLSPVPRVEIRLDPLAEFSGGSAASVGSGSLSGGSASVTGSELFGGTASMTMISVPEGADSVTLWRRAGGRSMKVRGGVRRPFGEAFALLDHEAPFVQASYEAEFFAGEVALGRMALGSTRLVWSGDPDAVIVQQPLEPRLHAVVTNMRGSWPEVERQAPGELVYVQGARRPSLVSMGPRQGASRVPMVFEVPDRVASRRVLDTLGTEDVEQLPVWLVRAPNPGLLPPVFFCEVLSLREVDVTVAWHQESGISRFEALVTEIEPPAPALVVSPLSYADLDAAYASYAERDAAYASYHEMDTDWSLAGAAGGA